MNPNSSVSERLIKCFSAVFPDLPTGNIPLASVDSVAAWDSMATVNLVALIEEEFQSQIETDVLPELVSFARIQAYLEDSARGN